MSCLKRVLYIVCLCLLAVTLLYEAKYNIFFKEDSGVYVPTARLASQVQEENECCTEGAVQEEKIAYLTFDDGPSDVTLKILDTLKEKEAVATFFLVGNELTPEREHIVKREIEQGNALGVHTFCHEKNKMYCNAESFFEDFNKASQRIEEVAGERPKLHRFPWGSNNGYVSSYVDDLHERLKSQGIRSYDWNVSGEDSVGGVVAQSTIFQNVKKNLTRYRQPILLLHDSATMKNTAAVLGQIIEYIRSEGYRFDTLEKREEYMFPASWRR